MPHKVTDVEESPTDLSADAQDIVKCFCYPKTGSCCFEKLPDYIRAQIDEYYKSIGPAEHKNTCSQAIPTFTVFPKLPAKLQKRIAKLCMPARELRSFFATGSDEKSSSSTLLKTPPAAAKVNRMFYACFKDEWKQSTVHPEASLGEVKPLRSYVNFALDRLIIDINHQLGDLNNASHVVQHSTSRRPGMSPLRIDEYWAHDKARNGIASLPSKLFATMRNIKTYWLVIEYLSAVHFTWAEAEEITADCRCVFSPMLKCLADPVTTQCHAFRYHVDSGRIECAVMERGEELNEILDACNEKTPNFAARVTFVRGDGKEAEVRDDGLTWLPLCEPSMKNTKYEKLRKRLDWGLVADVLRSQA